jgi:hypothetical protein
MAWGNVRVRSHVCRADRSSHGEIDGMGWEGRGGEEDM